MSQKRTALTPTAKRQLIAGLIAWLVATAAAVWILMLALPTLPGLQRILVLVCIPVVGIAILVVWTVYEKRKAVISGARTPESSWTAVLTVCTLLGITFSPIWYYWYYVVHDWKRTLLGMAPFIFTFIITLLFRPMQQTINEAEQEARESFLPNLDDRAQHRVELVRKLDKAGTFLVFLIGIPLGMAAIFFEAPRSLSLLLHGGASTHTQYLITPSILPYMIPTVITSASLVALIETGLMRLIAGENYRDYKRLQREMEHKLPHGVSLLSRITMLVALATAVYGVSAIFIYFGQYARFSDKGLSDRTFPGIRTEFHAWNSVTTIDQIPAFPEPTKCHRYRIRFSDGSTWTSSDSYERPVMLIVEPAMRYAAQRSGKHITEGPALGSLRLIQRFKEN